MIKLKGSLSRAMKLNIHKLGYINNNTKIQYTDTHTLKYYIYIYIYIYIYTRTYIHTNIYSQCDKNFDT